ncbi:hypothetical protein [Aliidiomarina sp.]|uniref:hypothetical protein n=1 Tax=Aliidiomarina sp. TaxID=1872439 RepID=UPI003A4E6291
MKRLLCGMLGASLLLAIGYFIQNSLNGSIPEYQQNISITYPDNGELITFLEQHIGEVVKLSGAIDMSLSNELSYEVSDLFGIDNFIIDPSTPLPTDGLQGEVFLQFEFTQQPHITYGGTGVVQFPLNRYFRVTKAYSNEPILIYNLTEIAQHANE